MQEKSLRHMAARRFAEAGIPIFPCLPNSKKPATEHGFHDATLDLAQIDAWWAEADYNIAFTPHSVGWGIVDPDGPEGAAAWARLVAEHGAIETYTVSTPRGGKHYYFEGELPTTAWAPGRKRCLGEHIDTRGRGSYALLPPSVFEGKPYVADNDLDLLPVPAWIGKRLAQSTDIVSEAAHGELDAAGNVSRAVSHLRELARRGHVAVEGEGGNNRTYEVACDVLNLGVSPEKCQELIEEFWNPHCVPPWESEELAVVIGNASSYAQNAAGAWAVAPASETFAAALDQLAPVTEPVRRSRFYFKDIDEQDETPDTLWMLPELIPDNSTILILAESGHFKSFITQDIALSLVSGTRFAGIVPGRTGPVFYGAHEGRNALQKERKASWLLARNVERDKARGFFVAPGPLVAFPEQCEEFREQIRVRLREPGQRKIAGIVLDTVAKSMAGLDENKAQDAGVFVAFCDSLRDEFECPVIALHHLGKDGKEHGRGSSALVAGFDTIIHVKRVPETLAVEVRVLQHKDAEERQKPWTFEGRKVGPSLAFFETDDAAHRSITRAHDIFEPRKIGAALAALDAYGFEKAVTTAVLATAVVTPDEGLETEEVLALQNRTTRALVGLSRKSLEAYCQKAGARELVWFLPAKQY
jgi:hypothetical protein